MHAYIDISDEVGGELFKRAPQANERSALLEQILKEYFETHPATKRADLVLINENADELNNEAIEVLDYQIMP